MAKRPAQPTQPELYCQSNGVLVIRAPNPGAATWLSVPINTSKIDVARPLFAKWLAKNKITNINAMISPINSLYGHLSGEGNTVAMLRAAKTAALQGSAPQQVPAVYDEALAAAQARKEAHRKKSRDYYHIRKAREKNGGAIAASSSNAHSLLAALAANLAAAATMLRMLEEAMGAPKSDIQN